MMQLHGDAKIITRSADFSDLTTIEDHWTSVLDEVRAAIDLTSVRRTILVNNSGSIEPIAYVRDYASISALRSAIDSNVTSVMWLSSLYLKFAKTLSAEHVIVNVSSLAAVKPFASQLAYCVGKAARDMLHAGIAAEEGDVVSSIYLGTSIS
jgi:NAD(P)-dependent dehydrogenase (short-subunit alcohol dehydrogenase family)